MPQYQQVWVSTVSIPSGASTVGKLSGEVSVF